MTPINSKYKTTFKRLLAADRAYIDLVDANDRALDSIEPDTNKYYRTVERHERADAKQWDKVYKYWHDLPLREQGAFTKQYKTEYGYTPVAK